VNEAQVVVASQPRLSFAQQILQALQTLPGLRTIANDIAEKPIGIDPLGSDLACCPDVVKYRLRAIRLA
jgi:hypothetical protein